VRADVRQLLGAIGVEGFRYWDPGDPSPDRDCEPAPSRRDAPPGITVALASPFAATGRTSLAATLVTLLAHSGARCAAVDLDPGAPLARRLAGEAEARAPGALGCETAVVREGHLGVRCLAVAGAERLARAAADPRALRPLLAATLGDPDWTVLDGPADAALLRVALAVADEVVIVLRPGDVAEGGAAAVGRWLREAGCGRAAWLLNRYDGRLAAHRSARGALRERLLPFVVDEDPAFAELDGRATLVEVAPESQVLRVLGELAARIGGDAAAAPRGRAPAREAR
jgi:cellulose biosynthesis protein BcsQ